MQENIRWRHRFSAYEKALKQLRSAIEQYGHDPEDIIKEGIIQRFEFTHELSWQLMKDYLQYEGIMNITGSRSATREAFNKGLVQDGANWMDMIETRNKTVHIYDEAILADEFNKIVYKYYPLLDLFYKKMKTFL